MTKMSDNAVSTTLFLEEDTVTDIDVNGNFSYTIAQMKGGIYKAVL